MRTALALLAALACAPVAEAGCHRGGLAFRGHRFHSFHAFHAAPVVVERVKFVTFEPAEVVVPAARVRVEAVAQPAAVAAPAVAVEQPVAVAAVALPVRTLTFVQPAFVGHGHAFQFVHGVRRFVGFRHAAFRRGNAVRFFRR